MKKKPAPIPPMEAMEARLSEDPALRVRRDTGTGEYIFWTSAGGPRAAPVPEPDLLPEHIAAAEGRVRE